MRLAQREPSQRCESRGLLSPSKPAEFQWTRASARLESHTHTHTHNHNHNHKRQTEFDLISNWPVRTLNSQCSLLDATAAMHSHGQCTATLCADSIPRAKWCHLPEKYEKPPFDEAGPPAPVPLPLKSPGELLLFDLERPV